MAKLLGVRGLRLFAFPKSAETIRDQIRRDTERLAAAAGFQIELIRSPKGFRKEARIKEILGKQCDEPGLMHVFSAMESYSTYRRWYDKAFGKAL